MTHHALHNKNIYIKDIKLIFFRKHCFSLNVQGSLLLFSIWKHYLDIHDLHDNIMLLLGQWCHPFIANGEKNCSYTHSNSQIHYIKSLWMWQCTHITSHRKKKKKLYASQTKSIIKAGIFPSVYDEKPRLFIKTAQRESIMTTPNQVSRQRLNSPKYRMGHSSFRFYTKLQRDELWWTENPGCSWSSVAVIYVYIYIDSMLPINHIKANSDHYKLKLYHNWLIKKKKIHKQ